MLKPVYKLLQSYRGWDESSYPFLVYNEKYDGYIFPNRNPGGDYYWVINKELLMRMYIKGIVDEVNDMTEYNMFIDKLEYELTGKIEKKETIKEEEIKPSVSGIDNVDKIDYREIKKVKGDKPVNKTKKVVNKKWLNE